MDTRAPKRYFRIPTGLPELTKNEPNLQTWCEIFKRAGEDDNSPGETEVDISDYISDDDVNDDNDDDEEEEEEEEEEGETGYLEFGVGRASHPSPFQR